MSKRKGDNGNTATADAPETEQDMSYEARAARAKELAEAKEELTKEQKFKKLANARVPRAIKAIRAIANLSNIYSYEYTEEQTKKIMDVLRLELDDLTRRFSGVKQAKQEWSID